jgi:hypothetical protein
MKKLIFSSLIGLALIAFTGCTNGSDAEMSKCQSGKCNGAKKCQASGKCGNAKKVAKKCNSASKCSAGKCGK